MKIQQQRLIAEETKFVRELKSNINSQENLLISNGEKSVITIR